MKGFVEKCPFYHKFYIMLSSYFNNSQSDTTLSNKTLEKNKLLKNFFQNFMKIFNKTLIISGGKTDIDFAKEYLEKQGYTGASGWGFHNDVMYEETLKLLEKAKAKNDRLVMVTKTLDMHQPYPYTGFSWNEMPDNVRSNKFITVRGVYWVDKTLEHFFKEAQKRGLMDDRTLFIITSDHNPHSGGEYTKLVTKAEDKQSIAPIPLIFVSKNLAPLNNLRTNEYASQIDLAPTLLYLLGIDVPDKFMGRNLLQPTDIPYALGYFGGKAFYWSDERHLVDQMDKPVPDTEYEDALTNYIIHYYGLWHQ